MATAKKITSNQYIVTLEQLENDRLKTWVTNPNQSLPQVLGSLVTLIFHSSNKLENVVNALSSET